mmetsp:Transcript_8431/g.26211  ORF Transcript_8431/g.26211 Transcript_8431/m.26211 type:complete len:358 (-) Transcript_8431:40-1113(-)
MFKRVHKSPGPEGSHLPLLALQDQKTSRRGAGPQTKQKGRLEITPNIEKEATTTGAARRLTPDGSSTPTGNNPGRSPQLNIDHAHEHFAGILLRKMERYARDHGEAVVSREEEDEEEEHSEEAGDGAKSPSLQAVHTSAFSRPRRGSRAASTARKSGHAPVPVAQAWLRPRHDPDGSKATEGPVEAVVAAEETEQASRGTGRNPEPVQGAAKFRHQTPLLNCTTGPNPSPQSTSRPASSRCANQTQLRQAASRGSASSTSSDTCGTPSADPAKPFSAGGLGGTGFHSARGSIDKIGQRGSGHVLMTSGACLGGVAASGPRPGRDSGRGESCLGALTTLDRLQQHQGAYRPGLVRPAR